MPLSIRPPAEYRLRRYPVEPSKRQALFENLPIQSTDLPVLHFLGHYYCGAFVDKQTGYVVIPSGLCAAFEGKEKQYNSKNYSAEPFLQYINDNITPIQHTEPQWNLLGGGKARQIISLGYDPVIKPIMEQTSGAKMVDLVTGAPYKKPARKAETLEERDHTAQFLIEADNNVTKNIMEYLLTVPPRYRETYDNQLERQWSAAWAKKDEIFARPFNESDKDYKEKKIRRDREERTLERIRAQPVPFVRPTGRSPRLYPPRGSLCNLKREVRAALTEGWTKLDLQAAQLAAMSKMWDIPELNALLQGENSIWEHFYTDLGLTSSSKPALKNALYKFAYGARVHTSLSNEKAVKAAVVNNLDREIGVGVGRSFMNHRVIKLADKARSKMRKKVIDEGGIYDCFGIWRAIEPDNRPYWKRREEPFKGVSWRSALAQQLQSAETILINECFEVAKETDEFFIALYLYDGVVIAWRQPRNKEKWIERMQAAVAAKAVQMGIPTRLVLES